ncbi:hypothetical protein KR074_005929 [Drosophila pseudoananassae]|nr:hypothetical protein KR074_005929 [Drosophila pseudoananassae]
MFLNDIGQPLILDSRKSPLEKMNGPLLLTSAAFKDFQIPKDWRPYVIGSEEDVFRLQSSQNFGTTDCLFEKLQPNESINIEIEATKIRITLVHYGKSHDGLISRIYYLENGVSRIVIMDHAPAYLDFIPKANTSFHIGLSQGIDVLFLDDESLTSNLNEDLYQFVHLLKPRNIYGLRKKELPNWLLGLRRCKDIYARP